MLLDIAPTLAMYEQTSLAFARAYWHWFFLIQPPPLPEALIESDPVRYVRSVMGQRHAGLAAFAPEALAEYERCAGVPGTAQGICADYRASAGIDLEHDRADIAAGRLLEHAACACCGASMAPSGAASTCWRSGASARARSRAGLALRSLHRRRGAASPAARSP